MASDLGDVVVHLSPDYEAFPSVGTAQGLLLVPLAADDVVRSALLWNLAVEIARQGGRATIVAPALPEALTGWGEPGRGPLGIEVVSVGTDQIAELAAAAEEIAAREASLAGEAAVVMVAVPPPWLHKGADAGPLLRRVLALARPDPREIVETYALLKRVAIHAPRARLGVTVFGVTRLAEARNTFERLASTCEHHLGCELTSYGLLVDDVHLSRSIVTGRPIVLSHPTSPAARALEDVARLLVADSHEIADE